MCTLEKIKVEPAPTKLDQQFALRLYSVAIQRVVNGSLTNGCDNILLYIATGSLTASNQEEFPLAQKWLDDGLLHQTIQKGLLHVIGESAFWSEVARDEWASNEELNPLAFFNDFCTLIRIADLSAIDVPDELRDSLNSLSYFIDESIAVDQAGIKRAAWKLGDWASKNFTSIVDVYVDDFANRALHNRQLCQEISLLCVSALGLLFSPDNAASTPKYTPNKGKKLFKRTKWPAWVKPALQARERGLCASCATSFSELTEVSHIDHIVPLGKGGSNDISNLQLLCSTCNNDKGACHVTVNPSFQNYIQVGGKKIPRIFVSLPPDYGGWGHPENIPPQETEEGS
jgi:5-methylcytosine-specific restriction endonuclease McrA